MKNKLNKMKICIIFAANSSDRIVSAVTYMKLRSITDFQASKHVYVPNKEEVDMNVTVHLFMGMFWIWIHCKSCSCAYEARQPEHKPEGLCGACGFSPCAVLPPGAHTAPAERQGGHAANNTHFCFSHRVFLSNSSPTELLIGLVLPGFRHLFSRHCHLCLFTMGHLYLKLPSLKRYDVITQLAHWEVFVTVKEDDKNTWSHTLENEDSRSISSVLQ